MDKLERRAMHEKIYNILSQFTEDETKHPWNGDNRHYYLCSSSGSVAIYDETMVRVGGVIYFASYSDAQRAVEAVGDQDILDYYIFYNPNK